MGGQQSSSWPRILQPATHAVDVLAEQTEVLPDTTDRRGWTPLYRAVDAGDEAEVWRLLVEGASARVTDDRGRTPLVVAACKGSARLCELLIDAGADVGGQDSWGRTALHAAAVADGGVPVVELLLRRGANLHTQDAKGRTALHCALQSYRRATAGALVKAMGPLLQRDDTGRTELHWEVAEPMMQLARQMVGTDGGSAGSGGVGVTPLARTQQVQNKETAGVPGAEACPYELTDAFGRTVLHWAAYAGYSEVVLELLKRGFSPWVKDLCGRDALIWAVESGSCTVVTEILQDTCYRECVDNQGQTALHVAAIRGDAKVTALLLDHGAYAGRDDSKGRIPLMYALREAHSVVAHHLATRGAWSIRRRDQQWRSLLHWAAVGGDAVAVQELLARGIKVNTFDRQHKTAAALAVEHGHQEAAAVLVGAAGFRVTRDHWGRTPLHGAAAQGWRQVALKLVSLGAEPHEADRDGVSPVQLAMRAGEKKLAAEISRAAWF